MKKLFLLSFLFLGAAFSYAQVPQAQQQAPLAPGMQPVPIPMHGPAGQPPVPPVPYYNEVYTIADCLNSYEGTTCIITGNITAMDNTYHRDRYILKDNTGEISVRLSHHVIGNNANIMNGTVKITGELRGTGNTPDYRKPKKHHVYDPHIAARYMEKQ